MVKKIIFDDDYYMRLALNEAQNAANEGEVPVGAVIVCKERIIAKTHNLTERLNDVTAHAELLAITAASSALGGKYLSDCTLYVTLEPCVMCAGALAWSQIGKLVFGASDPHRGFKRIQPDILHKRTEIVKGVLEKECSDVVKHFFKSKR